MNNCSYDVPTGPQQADLVYKTLGNRKIMLTFLPPTKPLLQKAPLYLVIPGGGWHHEDRQSMLDFSERSVAVLREKGFAVASIDYRVCRERHVNMRQVVNDCFDALRYLVHFADRLGINPDRIAVSGHSAGGHLALMLAYAPESLFRDDAIFQDSYTIKAAAPMSPPTILFSDEVPITHHLTDLGDNFRDYDTTEERKAMSPYCYVTPGCPPTLLCAGTSDRLVYSNSSELLHQHLTESGAESHLILSVGGGHCFEPMHPGIQPSPTMDEIQQIITAFVLEHV